MKQDVYHPYNNILNYINYKEINQVAMFLHQTEFENGFSFDNLNIDAFKDVNLF